MITGDIKTTEMMMKWASLPPTDPGDPAMPHKAIEFLRMKGVQSEEGKKVLAKLEITDLSKATLSDEDWKTFTSFHRTFEVPGEIAQEIP